MSHVKRTDRQIEERILAILADDSPASDASVWGKIGTPERVIKALDDLQTRGLITSKNMLTETGRAEQKRIYEETKKE